MEPEYRYAVICKRTKMRATPYYKTPAAAKGQLKQFFNDGRYTVGKFEMKLIEID
ncbi:hypothetical protein Sam46_gp52 [Bacillus phage vB_BcM_Sam46]|uniref:Uncharacterized protein n=2 Tax=Caudoviricetes TaxID=2731619 RepID=A0A6G9L6R4_9CAUD|nr:hypothetical protein Sam112_gp49 [Bacillus phage vB_BcM_Sam112]QIQ61253.1 hypothetical protein Sam46_gp52 [Bacillus phage vB_BcM_Sam46]